MELLQELVLEKLDETNRLVTLGRIGSLHQYFGDYDIALEFTQKAYELVKKKDDQKKMAVALHQMGMIYQNKGDYDEALKYYQQSLEIAKKIGDIPSLALSLGQMGSLSFEKKEFAPALKYFIQAFQIFSKIGSPNAEKAVKEIAKTREELPSEEYAAILKEFELPPEFIEQTVKKKKENNILESLMAITSNAAAAKKNNKEKKEEIITQLNQLIEEIEKLPNNDSEPLKSYFQMLLAFVKDENIDAYLKNLPDQLKELFEMAIHE